MKKVLELAGGAIYAGRDNSVSKCRKNGWKVGTRLVGDEGYGPTVIEITAIGEDHILAKVISENGDTSKARGESSWTLEFRDWRKVT